MNDLYRMRRRLMDDDIEKPEAPEETPFLSEKKLRFVAAWTGNLVAAARTAGYKDPKGAAYKLMKDPDVVQALQTKQEALLQESGEHLARTLPLSRADVIDRLWQLAQLGPDRTNHNITGQVKAAQALEQIFALNLDRNELIKRQFEGKSEAELEFYIVHGFLPHSEEQPPALEASTEAPQLQESNAASASPAIASVSTKAAAKKSEMFSPLLTTKDE